MASEAVGHAVLEQLRPVDEVAYVRFASVYKGFADVGDFEREWGCCTRRRPRRAAVGRGYGVLAVQSGTNAKDRDTL